MGRVAAIIPAAGLGTRMGAEMPKQFLELDGMPLVIFTLRRLAACSAITDFFLSTRADDVVSLQDKVAKAALGRPARVVHGGDTRQQSVANALAQVDPATEVVLVHDAVRPFVTPEQLDRVIAEARKRGAAILGIPAIDTVKEVKRATLPEDMALITTTIPRGAGSRSGWNEEGECIVAGSMPLRELNRWLKLTLPTDGPKTLNGLILETLEEIPDGDVSVRIAGVHFEVMRSDDQAIRTVKIFRPQGVVLRKQG